MTIRRLEPADADELAALLRENRAFLAPFVPLRGDAFFTAAAQRERIAAPGAVDFAILDGSRIAGTLTLSNLAFGPFCSASLGYWVAERLNGRGLATRAVGEAVAAAFGELGLHRVEAATLVENAASQRVLGRNGFERIGLARRYLQIAGAWRDHLLFERVAD